VVALLGCVFAIADQNILATEKKCEQGKLHLAVVGQLNIAERLHMANQKLRFILCGQI
jgi:hypothetical protein